ncbi:MAG: hypothetical protein BRC33_08475 [Cyanobacteria bacterium SW_9_44_58]|nr:MAG: hypothetical protein BRC33_08475 [Cyanobacteria bacterium SW_9_44_58]
MAIINESEANRFFDEQFYLSNNPDVENAVENGVFDSGFDHFLEFGLQENRAPNETLTFFTEETYLEENPDVEEAVNNGVFDSALDHFLSFGVNELEVRSESNGYQFFDSRNYLNENRDVARAVEDGILDSALEHYAKFGFSEGRNGLFTINSDKVVDEGNTLNFTVETFNQNSISRDTEIEFSFAGDIDLSDIAGDSLSGTATIPTGSSSTPFSVELVEDASTEGLESLTAEATVNNATLTQNAFVNDTSVNTPPTASNDQFSTEQGSSIDIPVGDLLANDSDAEGDSLTIEGTSAVENGTLEENSQGFAPGEGVIQHQGTVTFNEQVTVGNFGIDFSAERQGDSRSGFFVNDNADLNTVLFDVGNPDTLTVQNQQLTVSGADLLVSSELAQFLSEQGLASDDLTGADVGDVQIQASVSEGESGNLTVQDGVTSVSLDTELLSSAAGLTLSGTDSEATPAEGFDVGFGITEESSFTLEEVITSLTFTPDEDFTGNGSFQYTVSDGNGGTDKATVNVDVQGRNFSFSEDANIADEGQTLTFTLATADGSNVSSETAFDISLGGDIGSDDIAGSLDRTATIAQGESSTTVEVELVEDQLTEGLENLTATASFNGNTLTADAVVNDTSTTPPPQVTEVAPDLTTVNETDNNTVNFSIAAENAAEGDTVDLSFGGTVTADDIEGEFPETATVGADGNASVSLNFVADNVNEGSETFTLAATIGESTVTSDPVTVEDTSTGGMLDDVTVAPDSVTEGETATVTVNTSNFANGETVNYELSGDGIEAADFDGVPLTGTIEINDNTGSLELPVVSDDVDEGEETLTTTISSGAMTVTDDTVINDPEEQVTVDLDGLGTQQNPASEDAGTGAIQYTDSANDPNFVEISNFGEDDSIQFEEAQAEDVVVTPGANTNLTINNAGTVSDIVLNGVSTDFTVQSVSGFNELNVGDVTFA